MRIGYHCGHTTTRKVSWMSCRLFSISEIEIPKDLMQIPHFRAAVWKRSENSCFKTSILQKKNEKKKHLGTKKCKNDICITDSELQSPNRLKKVARLPFHWLSSRGHPISQPGRQSGFNLWQVKDKSISNSRFHLNCVIQIISSCLARSNSSMIYPYRHG